MKTIVVFTQSYPYTDAGESSFLEPELAALRRRFDRLIVVPRLQPPSSARPRPTDGAVELSLAKRLAATPGSLVRKGASTLASGAFYREMFDNSPHTRVPRGLGRAFAFAGMAATTSAWARSYLRRLEASGGGRLVLYTYWMNFITEGLAALRRSGATAVPVVTRAHGWDLYEDRREPAYIPFRRRTIGGVSKLCLISTHGLDYLKWRYPESSAKYELHRLGVPETGVVAQPSTDGVWRLLSCSFAVPVKRLTLLLAALHVLSTLRPTQRIEWSHIGGGPEVHRLRELATTLPPNIRTTFTGTLDPATIVEFYRSRPIDLFVNVSESEGLPVSIMECQRAGVPVLATDVGGSGEIVTTVAGRLMPREVSPRDIADAIAGMLDDAPALLRLRPQSVVNWRERFHATTNYGRFADSVAELA